MRTQVLKSSNTGQILRSSYPPNNGAPSFWENVPLSIQIDPPLKYFGKPPRMMPRHLQRKPTTQNSQNPFSSARMNPSSMNGATPLLETPTGAPSLYLHKQLMWNPPATEQIQNQNGVGEYCISETKLGTSQVESFTTESSSRKPPMLGSLARSQKSKDKHR